MEKNDNWTIIKQQLRLAGLGILFWLIGGVLSYFFLW
ncbi:hypothetical protein F901_03651 [Acinetobacter dispersus]|nr:hypothetical protein F901_03651 [Acinetobacter dispersus]